MNAVAPADVRSLRERLLVWMAHRYYRLARSMTIGVRAACFDAEGRVFLVRHSYVRGWYMPGGGVERHETVEEALVKELREEGNLRIVGRPALFHIYLNSHISKRDHVVFYRVDVEQTAPRAPDYEIVESGFFALDRLPPETTGATRRRLSELAGETVPGRDW